MGGGKGIKHQNALSLMPVSAYNADKRIESLQFKIEATPTGGHLIGILQPIWNKALESSIRLDWLEDMIRRNLVVRDIFTFYALSNA